MTCVTSGLRCFFKEASYVFFTVSLLLLGNSEWWSLKMKGS